MVAANEAVAGVVVYVSIDRIAQCNDFLKNRATEYTEFTEEAESAMTTSADGRR